MQANIINGIPLSISMYNTIFNNLIANSSVGIWFHWSSNNTIYGNNFINNEQQIVPWASVNRFDNGSLGNYWSDYTGQDLNGDGMATHHT